jgi:hypothetical protein
MPKYEVVRAKCIFMQKQQAKKFVKLKRGRTLKSDKHEASASQTSERGGDSLNLMNKKEKFVESKRERTRKSGKCEPSSARRVKVGVTLLFQ